MPTVHLVHGFNVRNGGKTTTDKLVPYFQRFDFETIEHDYGWLGLLGSYTCNAAIGNVVAMAARWGDIGCGHSNGCAILTRAADAGAKFTGLIFINPALDADMRFAPQVQWIHVYHNADDKAVTLAGLLPNFINKRWGNMGAYGYTGDDPRVTNVNCGTGPVPVSGHSDIFNKLDPWGHYIALKARGESAVPASGHP